MKLETFFEKFDQFADAPDAVAKIRSLLIHFAVIGKLVPRDPREKPVELTLSGLSQDSAALPTNWRSGLLGEAFTFEYGDNLPAPKRTETGEYPVYGSNGIVGTHDTYLTKEPAIIVGRKGSAGALNIATGPSWTTDVAYFVRPPRDLDLRFTYYLFSTLRLDDLGKGIKPGLSRKEVYALSIALPPLAEQKRIVAKVDELMALCDRLEAQQKERETRHVALARASLARFADAPTPPNLHYLFHPSYTIPPADLRKSILTLAVQGKLVPQDPNDEPVAELLAELDVERRRFAQVHKFRAPIVEAMADFPFPFSIPPSWRWCRLSSMCNAITDGDHLPPPKSDVGIAFLTIGNITTGKLDFEGSRFVPKLYYRGLADFRRPIRGDILYTVVGATYGRPALVDTDRPFCVQRHIAILKPPKRIDVGFLMSVLRSPLAYEQATASTTGTAQPTIPLGSLRNFVAPLPPLAEQRRIVAKVNQLMVLVDRLETEFADSRDTAADLLEAIFADLTTVQVGAEAFI